MSERGGGRAGWIVEWDEKERRGQSCMGAGVG